MIRLSKVVSNFQPGWNIAAIHAAREVGLETAGSMPRDFAVRISGKTMPETVLHPEYGDLYGARVTPSPDHAQSTRWNVRDSDLTVLFAFTSTQETLHVLSACEDLGKPLIRIRSAVRPDMENRGSYYLIDRGSTEAEESALAASVRRGSALGLTRLPTTDMLEPASVAAYAALIKGSLPDEAAAVLHIAGNPLRHFEEPAEAFLTAVFRELQRVNARVHGGSDLLEGREIPVK